MPKYGTCSECRASVWLTENGTCPHGHGPECISGIGESAAPQAAASAGKKSNAVVIAIVVVVLLLCCLIGGILMAIAIPTFNAASTNASERACFAQQRAMEGVAMQWAAESEENDPAELEDYNALVEVTVPTYIFEEQVCVDGGDYEYDPDTVEVSCTLHGHYK